MIPTYNRRDAVLAAVGSALAGSDGSVAIVVADDGSTDGTVDAIRALNEPRVTVISLDHSGVCAARNAGVAEANSLWLMFLDSDDGLREEWWRVLAPLLADRAGLVSWAADFLYPDGTVLRRRPEVQSAAFGEVRALFLAGTFAVRSEVFAAVGGYLEGLGYGENTELGMRLGLEVSRREFDVSVVDQVLLDVRAEHRAYDARRYYEAGELTLQFAGAQLRRDRRLLASYLAITGVAASRLGKRRRAVQLLWSACRARPAELRNPARLVRAMFAAGSWR